MVNPILFQSGLPNLVGGLQSAGFYTYLFPFLLSLAILYSLIHFSLGNRVPKAANGLISIILSFFVMLYTASNSGITSFFANLSGQFLIIGSGILFLIIILGLVGFKFEDLSNNNNFKWAVVLFLILIGFILFTGAGGMKFLNIQGFAASSDFWTMVFFVIIVAVVFMFLTKEGDGGGKKEGKKE